MKNKRVRRNGLQCMVAFIMLASTLFNTGIIFADDVPADGDVTAEDSEVTEEPTAVPTEIPTEVPTEVPVADPTDVPTTVPTEVIGDEPTEEPTAVPTEIPTEIATEETPTVDLTLTPTVTPTEEVISAQDVTLTGPEGTVYTRTPYFYWNYEEDAYKYQLFVYQKSSKGDIKMFDKLYMASKVCDDDAGTCKVKSPTSLAFGSYYWKMRACYGDKYGYICTDLESAPSMEFVVSSTTPTAYEPNGTIYTNTPTFTWTGVADDTEQYYLQVYDSDGHKVAINGGTNILESGDATCETDEDGEYICSYTDAEPFDNGSYKWRVRAFYSGKWRSYSGYKTFSVASDIDENFDSYAPDFTKLAGGTWLMGTEDGNTVYYTNGVSKRMTNLRSKYIFDDVNLTAIVKRAAGSVDGSYPASYIGVRMGKSKSSSTNMWYTGYIFGYTTAGTYAVWRVDSASRVETIQPWTEITGTFNDDGWNELNVTAEGKDFTFSINGDEVASFSDGTYSKGYVGFEMFRPDSTILPFYIDSVTVNNISSTSVSGASISSEQAAANLAAQSSSTGSVEGYDGGTVHSQATTPNPIEPSNTTIYTNKPTFKWDDTGDEKYYLYLAKITTGGIDKVYGKTLLAETYCSDGECAYTSASTLSQNDYVWKVKSYDGTDYSDYSDNQYFTVGTTMPTAKKPYSTGYDNQPTFTWTEIVDAEQYNIVAYDSSGKKVISWWPLAGEVTCDADQICSVELEDFTGMEEPNWITPESLDNGKYRWRVRALYNSRWGIFSAYRDFTVASEFDSDFTSNSKGWSRLWGGKWYRSNGYYYSTGSPKVMNTAKYAYVYSDFTFTAVVKREHTSQTYSSYPANYIAVRMGNSHTNDLQWYSGYLFGYTNAGYYSIWRVKGNGKVTALQPWTETDAINKGDWNQLTVTAEGSSFEFYINGELLTTVEDDNDSKGYVGFEFYRPASAYLGKFYVDEAQLTLIESTSLSVQSATSSQATVSAEQQALNEAAINSGIEGSIEGTPLE